MQVSVEKVSPVKRRLTIVVPANQVEEAYTKQINDFAKKANIKGFRPGKAPLSYIQERFGADARKEALNEVIESSLNKALVDEKLRPVSTPQVEPKSILANQPLEFIASFEVLPEIETVSFNMEAIEKPVVEITDEDITRVVQQLHKQFTKWNLVERNVQEKDRVVIDYYAIFEGKAEEENKIQNFPLEIGGKVMLPGFEEGLIGTKAGDEKTLNLSFPNDFAVAERAGKPVDFVVQIKQVFEPEVLPINEDFIKKLGIASGQEEDLKKQIRHTLEQERDRLVTNKLKEQIFQKLLEQNPLEVPPSLVAREAKNIHDEIYQEQNHKHNHSNEEMASFNEVAQKRVALGLLVAEYAKQFNMQADKARVMKRMQEIASAYEHPAEVLKWLSAEERRSGIEAQILEDQVIEKMMENISVTEKNMSYADLKGIRI